MRQYTVKEVLRIERDRGQEEEVRTLREEMEELRRQKTIKDNDLVEITKRVTILAEEKDKEQEVITEEEVIKMTPNWKVSTASSLTENKRKPMAGHNWKMSFDSFRTS